MVVGGLVHVVLSYSSKICLIQYDRSSLFLFFIRFSSELTTTTIALAVSTGALTIKVTCCISAPVDRSRTTETTSRCRGRRGSRVAICCAVGHSLTALTNGIAAAGKSRTDLIHGTRKPCLIAAIIGTIVPSGAPTGNVCSTIPTL